MGRSGTTYPFQHTKENDVSSRHDVDRYFGSGSRVEGILHGHAAHSRCGLVEQRKSERCRTRVRSKDE